MLNLEQIVFTVDTRQLDDASKKLLGLASDAQELTNNLSAMAAKNAAAQKKSADANLANAKATKLAADAELVNAKAKEAAANAAERMASATLKEAKAKDDATKASSAFSSMTEKQRAITEEMIRGFSKGQASIIATAKALGEGTGELERYLTLQRKLQGNDPFDKSLGAVQVLKNQFSVLKDSMRSYSDELGLTRKQMNDLARDKLRLIAAAEVEQKSIFSVRTEIRQLKEMYSVVANEANRLDVELKNNSSSAQSTAKAMSFLERELARTDNVLEGFGNELNQVSSNRLMRFREELKKSGVDAVTASAMLEKYENNLRRIGEVNQQKLAKNRKDELDYLARATSVQLGDIGISLAGGQNPLLVLIQQGDQLRGVLNQVGADANEMSKAMSMAFSQIVMGAIDVSKALGGFVLGAFVDMGKGLTRVVDNLTGVFSALEMVRYQMTLMAYANKDTAGTFLFAAKAIGVLQTAALSLATAAATASVVAMLALVVATAQYVSENKKLVDALALTSGSLGITKDVAEGYILTLAGMGVTTGVATEAIVQMGKAGNLTKDEILMIGESAQQMQQWTSASVEDVVKQFSKLKEKPVEALTELAKRTGMIRPELIATVEELQKQGKYADAAATAMKAYGQVTNQVAGQAKQDYNELTRAVIDWSNEVSKGFSKFFKGLLYNVTPLEQVAEELESVRNRLAKERSLMFKDNKLIAQLEMQERLLVGQLGTMRRQQYQQEQQAEAVARQIRLDEARKNALEDINKSLDSLTKKELTLEERKAKAVNDYRKDIAKKLSINIADVQVPDEVLAKLEKIAQIEHERDQRKEKQATTKQDPIEKFYIQTLEKVNQQLAEAEGKTNQLTKAEMLLNQVRRDSRYGELTAAQQKEIELIAQRAEIAQRANATDEIRNKLIGDATGLGKDYYETVEKINGLVNKPGGLGAEEATRLLKALGESTPLAKAMQEYYDKMQASIAKYNEEHRNGLTTLAIERDDLDFRLSLLGKSADEQRRITVEYEKQKQSAQALLEYQRKIAEIDKDTTLDLDKKSDAKLQALERYQKRLENINSDAAVKYAEDFQKEFDRISNGLTDAIVTALFEGGRSGSKKLRDLIVNELKKPVVMVIQSVVNATLGGLTNGLFGTSGAAGAAAGAGGGFAQIAGMASNAYSALTGGISKGITEAFGKFATSSAGTSLGLSTPAIAGNNYSAYVAPQLTSTGTMLGSALSMAGSGLAGFGISSAISGGYSTGGNTVNALAGIASAFLGPVAGVVGGLINRMFGRKLKDAGIEGTLGGSKGFQGQSYQFYKGGWLASDKTKYSPIDPKLEAALSQSFKAFQVQVGTFATTLGLDASKVADFTTKIKLSTQGLDEAGVQAAIEEALAKASDELAQQVIGTWETTTQEVTRVISENVGGYGQEAVTIMDTVTETVSSSSYVASKYAKENEKAIDTLTRLASSLSAVNGSFDNLGRTLYDVGLEGAAAASKIVELFGGLERFSTLSTAYYENFYSDEERRSTLIRQLGDEFKKQNLVLPSTVSDYRRLVDAQDLSTDSGQKLYKFLLELAPTFAQVYGTMQSAVQSNIETSQSYIDTIEEQKRAAEELARKEADLARRKLELSRQIYTLANNEQGLRETELALRAIELSSMDESLRNLQEIVWRLEDFAEGVEKIKTNLGNLKTELNNLQSIAMSNTDRAFATLERSVNKQIELTRKEADALGKTRDTLRSIFEYLREQTRELYGEATDTSSMLASQSADLIANALSTGVLPDQEELQNAVESMRKSLDSNVYTTKTEYERARILLGIDLERLANISKSQLTEAERQLDASEAAVTRLEGILENARTQIDVLRSIDKGVLDVGVALQMLAAALQSEEQLGKYSKSKVLQGSGSAVFDTTTGNGMNAAGVVFNRTDLIQGTQAHLAQGTVDASLDVYRAAAASGFSMSQLETIYGLPSGTLATEVDKLSAAIGLSLPKFADGGDYRGGLALVGEEGPELINFNSGGRVYTAQQTSEILSSRNNQDVVIELKAVSSALEALRYEVRAIAVHTSKINANVERVIVPTNSGEAFQTTSVV